MMNVRFEQIDIVVGLFLLREGGQIWFRSSESWETNKIIRFYKDVPYNLILYKSPFTKATMSNTSRLCTNYLESI